MDTSLQKLHVIILTHLGTSYHRPFVTLFAYNFLKYSFRVVGLPDKLPFSLKNLEKCSWKKGLGFLQLLDMNPVEVILLFTDACRTLDVVLSFETFHLLTHPLIPILSTLSRPWLQGSSNNQCHLHNF